MRSLDEINIKMYFARLTWSQVLWKTSWIRQCILSNFLNVWEIWLWPVLHWPPAWKTSRTLSQQFRYNVYNYNIYIFKLLLTAAKIYVSIYFEYSLSTILVTVSVVIRLRRTQGKYYTW